MEVQLDRNDQLWLLACVQLTLDDGEEVDDAAVDIWSQNRALLNNRRLEDEPRSKAHEAALKAAAELRAKADRKRRIEQGWIEAQKRVRIRLRTQRALEEAAEYEAMIAK